MQIVRMLVSAEGEFSLLAGTVYKLEDRLAASLVAAGHAEEPEAGSYATPTELVGSSPAAEEPAPARRSSKRSPGKRTPAKSGGVKRAAAKRT